MTSSLRIMQAKDKLLNKNTKRQSSVIQNKQVLNKNTALLVNSNFQENQIRIQKNTKKSELNPKNLENQKSDFGGKQSKLFMKNIVSNSNFLSNSNYWKAEKNQIYAKKQKCA